MDKFMKLIVYCTDIIWNASLCMWCKCSDPIDLRHRRINRRGSGRGPRRGGGSWTHALSQSYLKPLVTGRGSDLFGAEDDWWKITVRIIVRPLLVARALYILPRPARDFSLRQHFAVFTKHTCSQSTSELSTSLRCFAGWGSEVMSGVCKFKGFDFGRTGLFWSDHSVNKFCESTSVCCACYR